MIGGQVVGSSGGYSANVASQNPYNTIGQVSNDYDKKGAMSYDGLYRPYSTNPGASGIAHFESPTGSGYTEPDVNHLNPFISGHDIQSVIVDTPSGLPEDIVIPNLGYYPEYYRPIAFKGPMVLCGWGIDIDGNPVPAKPLASGETEVQYVDNYLQRSDLWKTGPIDIRWDDDRKVWVTGGTGGAKLVQVLDDGIVAPSGAPSIYSYKKVYKCRVVDVDFDESANSDVSLDYTDNYIYAGNFRDISILTNKLYLVNKIGGKYLIDSEAGFVND